MVVNSMEGHGVGERGVRVCSARGMPSVSMHRIDLYGEDVHVRVSMALVCASRTYMV
jgi:hypothetical protein